MQSLFYYKFVFMTELLIAETIFCFHLRRRKYFVLRLFGAIAICYLVAGFYPLASYSGWYASLMFIAFFLCGFLSIPLCFETSWKNALFLAVTSYTVQHISYEIFHLLSLSFSSDSINLYSADVLDFSTFSQETLLYILIYVMIYFVVYVAAYFILARSIYKHGELQMNQANMVWFIAVILVIDIVINAFVVYIDSNVNSLYEILIAIYNILSCVMALVIEFTLANQKLLKDDLETTRQLLEQAKKQYQVSKESIDDINLKIHDLKYQIGEYAKKGELNPDALSQLQESIAAYDTQVETGNKPLDIILTEKSTLCHNRHIQLTCMADGKNLNFLNESDLYVLFGNLLDNAIEAVTEIPDESKRCISLNVKSEKNLISISTNNFYSGERLFDEKGMPLTSKADKRYHGYGTKSIRMLVDKYHGDCSFSSKDGIFTVNILIPIAP